MLHKFKEVGSLDFSCDGEKCDEMLTLGEGEDMKTFDAAGWKFLPRKIRISSQAKHMCPSCWTEVSKQCPS